jgi:hypothetical protein
MDLVAEIRAVSATVEAWISRVSPERWLEPRAGGWNDKDLLGHLAAWSDLLMDQVQALQQERPEAIDTIEVHAWNAVQVAKRRDATVDATVAEWRRAWQRVYDIARDLTPDVASRRWRVTWAPQPTCIDDLLRLWLVHIDQHRSRLERPDA